MTPFSAVCGAALTALLFSATLNAGENRYLSPGALVPGVDGKTVFVACSTAAEVLRVNLDPRKRQVEKRCSLPGNPVGLAVTPDGRHLLVTCAGARNTLEVLDSAKLTLLWSIPLGQNALAPVLSRDASKLYLCYRFDNSVGVVDLRARKEVLRIPVVREPVAAALSKDGKYLLVANHLPAGVANADKVSAAVTVIDCSAGKVAKQLSLPSGSTALTDIRVSPDGRHCVVTHVLARFQIPAGQLERGWMNTNAKTIIDMENMEVMDTVLLDSVDSGAANPWGAAWNKHGDRLVVAHAGTHEVSVVNFPAVLAKIKARREALKASAAEEPPLEPSNDLSFLEGARTRVKLPKPDLGPRSVAVLGNWAVTANYFSDSLSLVDLSDPHSRVQTIRLGPVVEMDDVRRGELYFHDASICFQTWQSCSSCHPGEARADALNWDLLNDGIANPKNTKSLLLAHRTPPSMSMGVRATAEEAVRAGIRNTLMTVQPENVSRCLDAYLKSLKPQPSPRLVEGKLSAAAARGERLFKKADCASCHPQNGLFTDLQSYDVATRTSLDRMSGRFDTPTLVEVWRTAPYLHDGSAATIRDVLTTRNNGDQHGETSNLLEEELNDLCEYVLSL